MREFFVKSPMKNFAGLFVYIIYSVIYVASIEEERGNEEGSFPLENDPSEKNKESSIVILQLGFG